MVTWKGKPQRAKWSNPLRPPHTNAPSRNRLPSATIPQRDGLEMPMRAILHPERLSRISTQIATKMIPPLVGITQLSKLMHTDATTTFLLDLERDYPRANIKSSSPYAPGSLACTHLNHSKEAPCTRHFLHIRSFASSTRHCPTAQRDILRRRACPNFEQCMSAFNQCDTTPLDNLGLIFSSFAEYAAMASDYLCRYLLYQVFVYIARIQILIHQSNYFVEPQTHVT
jgi:hypothetical protein